MAFVNSKKKTVEAGLASSTVENSPLMQECVARALLLGMKYDDRSHFSYYDERPDLWSTVRVYDPFTNKPMTLRHAQHTKFIRWDDDVLNHAEAGED